MKVERDEWGIPDWRNPEGYLKGNLSMPSLFAWEFLRRSQIYRSSWDEWRDLQARHGVNPDGEYLDIHDETSTDLFDMEPPALPGETFKEYNCRLPARTRYTYTLKGRILSESWGVYFFEHMNPRYPYWSYTDNGISFAGELLLSFGRGSLKHYTALQSNKPQNIENVRKNEVLIRFDVNRGIPEQIELAKKILENSRKIYRIVHKSPTKLRPGNFPAYLRIFDAYASGYKAKEIASSLYPRENTETAIDKVRKAIKEARRLVASDWKRILEIPDRSGK
ncbi:MAG: hypothetical protein QM601_07195 [Pseudoxanthomonas sp.]